MNWLASFKILGYVEHPFGWTMRDQDVDSGWDRLPNGFEFGAWFHVRPIKEHRRVGRSENLQAAPFGLLVNKKCDVRIVVGSNQALFDGSGVIARDEELGRDVELTEPTEEGSGLGFVEPSVS